MKNDLPKNGRRKGNGYSQTIQATEVGWDN